MDSDERAFAIRGAFRRGQTRAFIRSQADEIRTRMKELYGSGAANNKGSQGSDGSQERARSDDGG